MYLNSIYVKALHKFQHLPGHFLGLTTYSDLTSHFEALKQLVSFYILFL